MNKEQQRKRRKSRTLIGAMLAFFGINAYEKETGAAGCTPLSVVIATAIGVIAAGIVLGPVAHAIPPFNQPATSNQPNTLKFSTTPSPTIATSNAITASFNGDLNGPFTATSFNSCGINSGVYKVDINGTIGGTAYEVLIEIDNYAGPGNYATNNLNNGISGISVRPTVPADGWNSLGQSGQITVKSDDKSGTFSASLISAGESQAATQAVGNWSCI